MLVLKHPNAAHDPPFNSMAYIEAIERERPYELLSADLWSYLVCVRVETCVYVCVRVRVRVCGKALMIARVFGDPVYIGLLVKTQKTWWLLLPW